MVPPESHGCPLLTSSTAMVPRTRATCADENPKPAAIATAVSSTATRVSPMTVGRPAPHNPNHSQARTAAAAPIINSKRGDPKSTANNTGNPRTAAESVRVRTDGNYAPGADTAP